MWGDDIHNKYSLGATIITIYFLNEILPFFFHYKIHIPICFFNCLNFNNHNYFHLIEFIKIVNKIDSNIINICLKNRDYKQSISR